MFGSTGFQNPFQQQQLNGGFGVNNFQQQQMPNELAGFLDSIATAGIEMGAGKIQSQLDSFAGVVGLTEKHYAIASHNAQVQAFSLDMMNLANLPPEMQKAVFQQKQDQVMRENFTYAAESMRNQAAINRSEQLLYNTTGLGSTEGPTEEEQQEIDALVYGNDDEAFATLDDVISEQKGRPGGSFNSFGSSSVGSSFNQFG